MIPNHIRTINFRGWTIEQRVADFAATLDRVAAANLIDTEDFLRSVGATPEELEEGLKFAAQMLKKGKEKCIKEHRAWLLRGGERLQ